MKNIFKILIILVVGAVTFSACDREPELPWGSFDDMEYADDFYVYNLSWLDDTLNTVMPAAIAEQWHNTLQISHVRGEPQNVDLFIYFNDGTNWHGPYDLATGISFPYSLQMDGQTFVNAIPAYNSINDFEPGHQYQFGMRITTTEGTIFKTIDVIGGVLRNQLSPNIRNYPGAGFVLSLRAVAICGPEPEEFAGTWVIEDWSDRFGAPDSYNAVATVGADGETIMFSILNHWTGVSPDETFGIAFDKSNPYAWVPYYPEDNWWGMHSAYPHMLKIAWNTAYPAGTFESCEMIINMGTDIEAHSADGGTFLGWWDYGFWTFTKVTDKDAASAQPRAREAVELITTR